VTPGGPGRSPLPARRGCGAAGLENVMTATGWIGEDDGPAMPVTSMLLGMRQRGPGDTFAAARFRADAADAREARAAAANAPDPDERAANLVAAGYAPGAMFGLSQQLADTNAELESEREKIARGERRAEHVRRDLAAGRVGALDAARRLMATSATCSARSSSNGGRPGSAARSPTRRR
jgi:hypothetical protein